jgi:hypothetical protein
MTASAALAQSHGAVKLTAVSWAFGCCRREIDSLTKILGEPDTGERPAVIGLDPVGRQDQG